MILVHTVARGKAMRHALASTMAVVAILGTGLAPVNALDAASASTTGASPAASTDNALVLSVGGSRVINLSAKMSDVVIADPAIADVHVRSENQLYILAKAPGETTIFVTAKTGKILYSGTVRVGTNLTSIDQMLKLAMPEDDIRVATMNGMVLLTGTILAPEDAAEAERLTQAFVGKDVTVVSRLKTATPLQVNLQVKISEVNRTLIHKVGTNISGIGDGTGSFSGYVGHAGRQYFTQGGGTSPTDPLLKFIQPSDNSTTLGFVARMFGMDVIGALDLAENSGLATTLAQPNLTSLSGETASFLAGGEYPYQVTNGTQGNSIEFKQYGVQLAFTPTVLADGRISLRVRPTVSSLDFSINSAVPALKSRTAETTVELGSGQAFMIAGLLSNDSANTINKVPGIGNIPILGSLFKSRAFQKNETELVIVVTPYLVKPVNAADIRLPTDGFRSATEAQGLLLQQGNDGISGAKPLGPTLAPATPGPQSGTTAPGLSAVQPNDKRRKPAKSAKSADASAPGFSF
ncbi:type II and III secretion system protein family protein [soil metagenome]